MPNSNSKFVWYELMTTDLAAAQTFYEKVVGWSGKDAGMEGMSYTIVSAGEAMVAGMMTLPEEVRQMGGRPGWIGYVHADDVDAKAAEFAANGGKVHRPGTDIPHIGRFAVVADPQGATICLFKPTPGPDGAPPPVPMGTPGHVGWHELYAADMEPAFAFYAKVFGWTKTEAMDMGAMGVYQLFAAGGGDAIGGMMTKPPNIPAPTWLYYFNVPGVEAAAERVKAEGGKVLHGPMEVPGGTWVVQCLDPQGAVFALSGPKA
jgi:hypothetical protein